MDIEVLKSYLVDLGFAVNQPQLKKFEGALQDASVSVERHTAGLVGDVLKWQSAFTGAFLGISTAAIGLVDHVAMADQQYRLFGRRMFMTEASARKLQIGLSALGASMEDIAWDPELRARFLQLGQDQDKLAAGLGTNFAQSMRQVRDLRFEFTRLQVAVQFLSMQFAERLFAKLGLSAGSLQDKLDGFVRWVQQHIPDAADAIAEDLVPILKDTWAIVREGVVILGELGAIFTNVIGLLTGDHAIEGATFNFKHFAAAIEHVVGWVASLVVTIEKAEQLLLHFANAAVLALSGRFTDAKNELLAGFSQISGATGAAIGGFTGAGVGIATAGTIGTAIGASLGTALGPVGTLLGGALGGSLGTFIGGTVGGATGAAVGGGIGQLKQMIAPSDTSTKTDLPLPTAAPQTGDIPERIARRAEQAGVAPRIAEAVAAQESGQRQFDKSGNLMANPASSARGIFQLLQGTAQQYGVDRTDTSGNIDGGVRYLADLLKHYKGSEDKAVAAYYWGQGNLDKAIARHQALPAEVLNYVRGVRAHEGQTVTVGDIAISITQPNASAADIQQATTRGVADAMRKQTQRNQAQLAYAG